MHFSLVLLLLSFLLGLLLTSFVGFRFSFYFFVGFQRWCYRLLGLDYRDDNVSWITEMTMCHGDDNVSWITEMTICHGDDNVSWITEVTVCHWL